MLLNSLVGLSSAVQEVLNDDVLTFFRRADQHTLGNVSITEVEEAIGRPIRDNDREISPELVEIAATATDGYPFLIQLIGYHIWRRQPKEQQVSSQDVSDGIDAARRRLGALVLAPELAELTEVERTGRRPFTVRFTPRILHRACCVASQSGWQLHRLHRLQVKCLTHNS